MNRPLLRNGFGDARLDAFQRLIFGRWFLPICVFGILGVIAVCVVVNSPPFDDEIYNIQLVETHGFFDLVWTANSSDVHPPLSYLINKILFNAFGSWDAVRIFDGMLTALGYATFVYLSFGRLTDRRRLIVAFLLATSSMMIWGASLRWYAYFDPLFTIVLGSLMFSGQSNTFKAIFLAISSVILFHIGYLASVAVPTLLVIHLVLQWNQLRRRDYIILMSCLCLALLMCVPQLLVFIQVHSHHTRQQIFDPLTSFAQTALTLIWGNAVFPFDVLPAIFGLIVVIAGFFLVQRARSSKTLAPMDVATVAALSFAVIALVLTGIGGKPRNSMVLVPLVAIVFSAAFVVLPRRLSPVFACCLVAYQLQGVENLVLHNNTIKGDFNRPFYEVLAQIANWQPECAGILVLNHDPSLAYIEQQNQAWQSTPYLESSAVTNDVRIGQCIALVKTYHGSIPIDLVTNLYATLDRSEIQKIHVEYFGYDKYAGIKSLLANDVFLANYITLELYRATAPVSLPDWYHVIQQSRRKSDRRERPLPPVQ